MMSPATAKKLGVGDRVGQWRGGEHGESIADMVTVGQGRRRIRAAVWVVPGHADDAFTLSLGYGRTHAGKVGSPDNKPLGFNANELRLSSAPWFQTGVDVSRIRETHILACVQAHHSMEGRDIVRSFTLKQYTKSPTFHMAHEHNGHAGEEKKGEHKRVELPSLYPNAHPYNGYKWGMAIDLTACTGCGACVVACQAENNIPWSARTR